MARVAIAALAAMPTLLAAQPAVARELTVVVTNVRNANGVVHIDVCRETEFLKDCAIMAEARAIAGTTVVRVPNVPDGVWAVQASHDENNNKKVDRALFGIPKEGVGFSNDALKGWSAPKWRDAQFSVSGDRSITLRMKYFLGPGGPQR